MQDSSGQSLPLYLLELFSLSIEEKEKGDFVSRKASMQRQMEAGLLEVQQLLASAFEAGPEQQTLADFFNPVKFKTELNAKFQVQQKHRDGQMEKKQWRHRDGDTMTERQRHRG